MCHVPMERPGWVLDVLWRTLRILELLRHFGDDCVCVCAWRRREKKKKKKVFCFPNEDDATFASVSKKSQISYLLSTIA